MGRMVGNKITLREFRSEDITGMRAWVTDDQVTCFLSGAFVKPNTWEQTEQYLNSILNGDAGGVRLVIAENGSLKYLGQCDLMFIDNIVRKAELAIVIGREHHGQGYGEEAIKLLLDFGFNQMNLNRIYLRVFEDNKRAIALYERCGFVHEGRLREDGYIEGKYTDLLCMGILKSEFASPKKALQSTKEKSE